MTAARQRVLAAAGGMLAPGALAAAAGVSSGVVRALVHEGVLEAVLVSPSFDEIPPDPGLPGAAVNPSQDAAASALKAIATRGGFAVALRDGVTGSGKTEVYLETVAALLAADPGAQVLVLLPEIALTQAVIARFEARFGAPPAEWHSGVAPHRRRRTWERVASGDARIVVGARSALFLPFKALRLVVVDEEHDGSYKQEDGFIYQARDLAVARAKIEGAAVILSSATPSLETLWNAQGGRYAWLRLADRHGAARLPRVELVDLRETPPHPRHWLSPPLVGAMVETLGRGEPVLLFLKRPRH